MSDTTSIGGESLFVGATAEVFLDESGNPVPVSQLNPLPIVQGFPIPSYNDVEIQYQNSSFPTKPTYFTFKKNGTPVYFLYLVYDSAGNLTQIAQD